MGLLQEKFQTEFPVPKNENSEWATDKSARRSTPAPAFRADPEGMSGELNCLPPGTDIGDQYLIDNPRISRVMSGTTDVTSVWSAEASREGFKRYDVKPTDDSYTAEHVDTFYGEAVSDGETGFAERGNLLDRI